LRSAAGHRRKAVEMAGSADLFSIESLVGQFVGELFGFVRHFRFRHQFFLSEQGHAPQPQRAK
jgi:hypothetical protein